MPSRGTSWVRAQPRSAGYPLAIILLLSLFIALLVLNRWPPVPAPPAAARPEPLTLATLPAGWPNTLQLGMSDGLGGAAAMRASALFGFRYQYLAGGVNTGNGWATWNPNGGFITNYIQES